MDDKTLEALKKSIQHWKENEAVTSMNAASTGASECALCEEFLHSNNCVGCPVFTETGRTGCKGTPYYDAVDAKLRGNLPVFLMYATEERMFLESLLPKYGYEKGDVVRILDTNAHGLADKSLAEIYHILDEAVGDRQAEFVLVGTSRDGDPLHQLVSSNQVEFVARPEKED